MNDYPVLAPEWCAAIAPPALLTTELHIWRVDLAQPEVVLAELAETLTPDERERVQRFRFEHHRQRAIASRGILRTLLGHYLQQLPAQLQFCYNANGKPDLRPTDGIAPIAFNVTHSENLALYAFAVQGSVGIDTEAIKPVGLLPQLIERYFSLKEKALITAQSPQEQERHFFYYWTAKEALTKATGRGITDLTQIELAVSPTDIQVTYPQAAPNDRWQVHFIEPQPGYAGAIAYTASAPQPLKFFDWYSNPI